MDFIKKNKILLGILLVVVIGAVGGAIVLGGSKSTDEGAEDESIEQNIKQVSTEEVGLTLEATSDGQTIIMRMTKLDGIKSVEYEATYDREFVDEQTDEVGVKPDGAFGSPVEIEPGQTELEREIYLGTCSATCTPHKVRSDIKFVIRINYENGEIGAIEETVPNPQEE